jgi:hypothetical protein
MSRSETLKHSSEKSIELIIYIATKLKDKPNYGSTLLGKSLCLIDSMSYLKTGKPISIFEYIKQDYGPTPEPAQYLSIRDKLVFNEELEKVESNYFGRPQIKYVAKRKPKITVFEKEEIVLINDVIDSICDINASDISDYTHAFISWIFAKHKEKLPFYTFLLTSKEPEMKDYEWAKKAVKAYQKTKNASL